MFTLNMGLSCEQLICASPPGSGTKGWKMEGSAGLGILDNSEEVC